MVFGNDETHKGQSRTQAGLLQQVLPQGLLPLSWGCGREPRHAGSGPKTPAHVSAGEESAKEPTSVIHFMGANGISLRVFGQKTPARGPGSLVLSVWR